MTELAVPATLESGLARLGVPLPEGGREKLAAYLALLAKWNRTYNLTAIREPERMVTHHALDSLAVVPHRRRAQALRFSTWGAAGGCRGSRSRSRAPMRTGDQG